ncbi:hypothetical protein ALC53_03323 [Atta colombica]|uniref:Uncharacterized protein n=1 Tax=Atta colombica TaxID=520822 RepID=A0A151I589_9HYME|nr:hypothetical protein ALC53_03323 [Atta colombica]
MRRPCNRINRGIVTSVLIYLGPLSQFLPNNYLPTKIYKPNSIIGQCTCHNYKRPRGYQISDEPTQPATRDRCVL